MSVQTWVEALFVDAVDGTAVANSTAEAIIFPDVTVPANYFYYPGRKFRVTCYGKYSTTGTPTLTFRVRWGGVAGTLLAASAACTAPSGVTNAMWKMEIDITCRSVGATGTLFVNGTVTMFAAVAGTVASATGEALVTPMSAGGVTAPATATCDLTADTALSISIQWSAASASNTATGNQRDGISLN